MGKNGTVKIPKEFINPNRNPGRGACPARRKAVPRPGLGTEIKESGFTIDILYDNNPFLLVGSYLLQSSFFKDERIDIFFSS